MNSTETMLGWLDENKVYHFALEIIPPPEYTGEKPPIFTGSVPLFADDGGPGNIEAALLIVFVDTTAWCRAHGIDPLTIDTRPVTEKEMSAATVTV